MEQHELGKKLLDLQDRIGKMKSRESELTGERKSIVNRLKTEFEVDTNAKIDKQLKEYDSQIEKLDESIHSMIVKSEAGFVEKEE